MGPNLQTNTNLTDTETNLSRSTRFVEPGVVSMAFWVFSIKSRNPVDQCERSYNWICHNEIQRMVQRYCCRGGCAKLYGDPLIVVKGNAIAAVFDTQLENH